MKNKKLFLKKFLYLVLVLGIITYLSSSSISAEVEYKWRLGDPWSRETRNQSMQLFCDLVNFYSDGRMEIEYYPGGILGSHEEIFNAVQQGSVEIGLFAPHVNLVPGGLFNWMPWTIETYDQCAVAFNHSNGILFKLMSKAWEEVGFKFLFITQEGPYGFGNNVRPLKTPDDFKNLKMRVSPSLGAVRALENMGAGTGMTVATIPWEELYNALERGVVDGCWSMWSSMVEERHMEVLKYYTGLGWLWGTSNVVVNREKWENLPSDIKEALAKAAEIAEIREYELHRREDAEFIKTIIDSGVEVYFPTPEERKAFREKANTSEIWEELCKPWLEKHYPGENMTQKVQEELERIVSEY